ncbi:MAG: hypothetical protein ACKVQT_35150 [Burkholderiales bacterium]
MDLLLLTAPDGRYWQVGAEVGRVRDAGKRHAPSVPIGAPEWTLWEQNDRK